MWERIKIYFPKSSFISKFVLQTTKNKLGMKRILALTLLVTTFTVALSACGNGKKRNCDAYGSKQEENSDRAQK